MTDKPGSHTTAVDWTPHGGKGDALFGTGATPAEKGLAIGAGALGALAIPLIAWLEGADWNALHYVVAAVVALDVVGGVVANGLNSAKRDHFGPASRTAATVGGRLVRAPIAFTALHVHGVIVGLLFPPHAWWWGVAWYAWVLGWVVLTRVSPTYLQRPVALAGCALTVLAAMVIPAPPFWQWLPLMLMLKLCLAHAVQEEPYRPRRPGAISAAGEAAT